MSPRPPPSEDPFDSPQSARCHYCHIKTPGVSKTVNCTLLSLQTTRPSMNSIQIVRNYNSAELGSLNGI